MSVISLVTLACASPPVTGGQVSAPVPASSDWDQTVAAAKREGKIVILGPQGADVRDVMVLPF